MPKRAFALEPDGPTRLEISWEANWENIAVALDSEVIGLIPDQKALRAGSYFTLPDGTNIHIQYVQKFLSPAGLRILRDGQLLPGSDSDPEIRLKNAVVGIFSLAWLLIIFGVIFILIQVKFLQTIGNGFSSIFYGVAILFLGLYAKHRSRVASIAVISAIVLDVCLWLVFIILPEGSISLSDLLFRLYMIITIIGTMRALRQSPTLERLSKRS